MADTPSPSVTSPARRAVVFGMDGVRFDVLRRAHTPHLDAIAADGFLAPIQVDPSGPTISGPVWATVATGVLPPVHRIFDNNLHGNHLAAHPDFLTRVEQARPGARTFALADWPPLVSTDHGGPVFPGGRLIPPGGTEHHGLATWEQCEDQLTEDAVEVLGSQNVHAAFVYFVGPDAVAHELGVGPEYVHAIEATDARMGRILAAIRARATAATEEWTVVVVTDHGHRDEGGHGGDSAEERTAWIAASGPTVPAAPPEGVCHADIHPHVLTALGIDLDPAWGLTGRPFYVDVQPA
ncbi:alkaline phosphatase family protein [Actinopolymorpha singaporensis]|uniref:Type I phosphodiesterase / nucleotide pyrophosphatase n=1 Tax=Actinopolymorpha singaporensis TaxID=117157 RepID=A0A1H1SK50_9ACTN|nr:alkaline phosphatase family protein [Actinopolymorpha singaporensis]SDS48400.1 Type I phosphodiesterase / nucleotide pyrophosphatase [Actinopolymorpha singaporensis]